MNNKNANHNNLEDKTNNSVENLEWCDNDYNNEYGTKHKRVSSKMRTILNSTRARILEQFPYAKLSRNRVDWKKVLQLGFKGDCKALRTYLKDAGYSVNGITKVIKNANQI